MRRLTLAVAILTLCAGPSVLFADIIPYPSIGAVPPTVTLTAASTGFITLSYVVADNTGAIDTLQFLDLTSGFTSAPFFDNKTTAAGTQISFSVKQGDVLVFDIFNNLTGITLSSDPSLSPDGINHAYVIPFAGGGINGSGKIDYSAGLFIGMEDLPLDLSNLDYNDIAFVVTNASEVPEPGTLALLATGLLGATGIVRRRLLNR
jgi:PEP-CTERM motif